MQVVVSEDEEGDRLAAVQEHLHCSVGWYIHMNSYDDSYFTKTLLIIFCMYYVHILHFYKKETGNLIFLLVKRHPWTVFI